MKSQQSQYQMARKPLARSYNTRPDWHNSYTLPDNRDSDSSYPASPSSTPCSTRVGRGECTCFLGHPSRWGIVGDPALFPSAFSPTRFSCSLARSLLCSMESTGYWTTALMSSRRTLTTDEFSGLEEWSARNECFPCFIFMMNWTSPHSHTTPQICLTCTDTAYLWSEFCYSSWEFKNIFKQKTSFSLFNLYNHLSLPILQILTIIITYLLSCWECKVLQSVYRIRYFNKICIK